MHPSLENPGAHWIYYQQNGFSWNKTILGGSIHNNQYPVIHNLDQHCCSLFSWTYLAKSDLFIRVLGEKVLEKGTLSCPSLAPHPKTLGVGSLQGWAALVTHRFLWSTESPAGSSCSLSGPTPSHPRNWIQCRVTHRVMGSSTIPSWCQGEASRSYGMAGCFPEWVMLDADPHLKCWSVLWPALQRGQEHFPWDCSVVWAWGWRWADFLVLLCPPWPGTLNCSFITCDVAVPGYWLSAPSASSGTSQLSAQDG